MKKNAFTLIELLAVIVILAIIALIATPIVLNIIKDSKESATLQSAEFYLGAVETAVAKQIIDDPTFKPESCDIQSDGNIKCGETLVEVEISGEVPTSGTITLETGKITGVTLVLSEKTITKNPEGKLVYGEPEVQLQSGLYDAEGNLIATWDELVNEYKINLDMDYIDENGELVVEETLLPGYILSSNEYLSKGVKLVIDSSVIRIGSAALFQNTNLEIVIIPNSVTSIGMHSFSYCLNLKEITIGNGVTNIESYAFYECSNLSKVIIGKGVTSIEEGAFVLCTNLKEVTIPDSVINIGIDAFGACVSLTKIIIPTSVRTIGDGAFNDCSNLTEIIIPASVTSIGKGIVSGSTKLKTINYGGTEKQWNSILVGDLWYGGSASKEYTINYNYNG